jgi:hypothetical protein
MNRKDRKIYLKAIELCDEVMYSRLLSSQYEIDITLDNTGYGMPWLKFTIQEVYSGVLDDKKLVKAFNKKYNMLEKEKEREQMEKTNTEIKNIIESIESDRKEKLNSTAGQLSVVNDYDGVLSCN